MELNKEQLEELKLIELDMLKQFISICEFLNLRYYLLGGTLLGAVRHKGFIPWDDDIDVGMPREDYEIFIKKAPEILPNHLFVQTMHSDPGFLMNFCKLRNSDTTFIETAAKTCYINHGVFIDIFPLDYYITGRKRQKRFQIKKQLLDMRIATGFYHMPSSQKRKLKTVIAMMLTCFLTPSAALKKREKLYKCIKKGEYLANHGGAWGIKEIVPQNWYAEGIELEFEGIKVKGPKETHLWLTQVYGDYMKLPPIDQRIGHHYTEIIDLKKPYREYIDKFIIKSR